MGTFLTNTIYQTVSSIMNSSRSQMALPIGHTVPTDFPKSSFQCIGDDDCMNMDSYRSSPGKDPVYSCPVATCSGGTCICGPDCQLDPYSGVCCQDLEVIGNDVFCVEDKNAVLNVKGDYLANDNILDSNGNAWDYISSPNSAFKRKIKGLGALSKDSAKQSMLMAKKQHIASKANPNACNVPDQLVYSKDKKNYIIIPGATICNIYRNYQ